jgi:hypothetical protein
LPARSSSSITSSAAFAAAPATGLPEKVLKYSYCAAKAAAMAGVVTTAAQGKPFAMGFPKVRMSGITSAPPS